MPVAAQTAPTAEDNFRDIARSLSARRDSAMNTLIEMSETQKKMFQEVKGEYDTKLRAIYDDRLALIREFSEVHDKLNTDVAKKMISRALELDRARTDLHEEYFGKMATEVSPVIAVLWIQLQTQFEGMADVKLGEGVPLAIR
jgi:hypothetical protein